MKYLATTIITLGRRDISIITHKIVYSNTKETIANINKEAISYLPNPKDIDNYPTSIETTIKETNKCEFILVGYHHHTLKTPKGKAKTPPATRIMRKVIANSPLEVYKYIDEQRKVTIHKSDTGYINENHTIFHHKFYNMDNTILKMHLIE